MASKNGKSDLKAERTERGIKVALSNDEWILFKSDGWTLNDELAMRKAVDFDALKLIVGWCVDWQLKDSNDAFIPFDQADLSAKLEAYDKREISAYDLPHLKMQTMTQLGISFWRALNVASQLPQEASATSG